MYIEFCYTANTRTFPYLWSGMQPSFSYIAESDLQRLRIRLKGDQFVQTKTPVAEIMPGVNIVLSGTSPCVLVEINCSDISDVLANEAVRAQFARICGPNVYKFLETHHFYFNHKNTVSVSLEEIKGWQVMWMPIQNDIFEQLGRRAVLLIEAESDSMTDIMVTPPNKVSNNVVPLFGDR